MNTTLIARPAAPRAAFGQIVRNQARLAWRQPAGLIAGIGLSVGLLILFGELPAYQTSPGGLGGLSQFDAYIPILIALAIGTIALLYLPGPLVSYREQGILRRLSTTPVPASWVLAAQMAVQACIMAVAVLLILFLSMVCFGASAPANPGGLILALALSIAALFTLGLVIAAVARTAAAARGIMAALFYPLMFFAGLWHPVQLMPGWIQDISHFTPLGAAVQATQYSLEKGFPPVSPLLVLTAYALVLGYLGKRFFQWQ
jgi:ABC-2 type transport system permease protein